MNKIEKKVLDFLKTGMVYSDSAICKNIGITQQELDAIYENLLKEGFLESYSDFQKRTSLTEKNCCHNSTGGNSSGCCNSSEMDYSNIKVLTDKAFEI